MVLTAWILFLFFGFFTLHGLINFLFSGLNDAQVVVFFLSVFITAVSAGVIWGGLFQ